MWYKVSGDAEFIVVSRSFQGVLDILRDKFPIDDFDTIHRMTAAECEDARAAGEVPLYYNIG
jgi:hypothetical protein